MATRTVCVGRRGCGKTYFAQVLVERLLLAGCARALIWDTVAPEPQFRGQVVDNVRDVAKFPAKRRLVFRHPVTPGEVCRLALQLRERLPDQELVVVIDEAGLSEVTVNGKCVVPELTRLLRAARGVHVIVTTQVPSGLPKDMARLADTYVIFQVTQADDLDRLAADGVPPRFLAEIPRLAPRMFVECQIGRDS